MITPRNKDRHRRSVETLSLSGHGDEQIIAEIQELIYRHTHRPPYSRNVLLQIISLIEDYLATEDKRG